jgi:3-oxo-5-alpha-steroid 4-dehydrogenase 1
MISFWRLCCSQIYYVFDLFFHDTPSCSAAMCSLQCRSLLYFHHFSQQNWCRTVQFQFGLVLFATGAYINLQSDGILRHLSRQRRQQHKQQRCQSTSHYHHDDDYQIPTGGLFDYSSSPHYFGEMLQWLGFCMACQWSMASTSFVVFTVANLLPRGVAQHAWYQAHFNGRNGNPQYPPQRKAVVPFLW